MSCTEVNYCESGGEFNNYQYNISMEVLFKIFKSRFHATFLFSELEYFPYEYSQFDFFAFDEYHKYEVKYIFDNLSDNAKKIFCTKVLSDFCWITADWLTDYKAFKNPYDIDDDGLFLTNKFFLHSFIPTYIFAFLKKTDHKIFSVLEAYNRYNNAIPKNSVFTVEMNILSEIRKLEHVMKNRLFTNEDAEVSLYHRDKEYVKKKGFRERFTELSYWIEDSEA